MPGTSQLNLKGWYRTASKINPDAIGKTLKGGHGVGSLHRKRLNAQVANIPPP